MTGMESPPRVTRKGAKGGYMFIVSVIQKVKDKTYFNRAGVGFRNRDGSINFKLDLLPNTQLHLKEVRENGDKPEDTNER